MDYYLKFVEYFPTVQELANAKEDDVLKLWQGLGYYSRARNLHFTAKHIARELNGQFPNHYKELLELKGVGPYTAAAISSISYNEPKAVVDGNVYRVLSRIFGIHTPIDSAEGKKEFQELANTLLDESQPGTFNQAVMEFGATVCTPKNPDCSNCIFNSSCHALKQNTLAQLPVKSKKIKKRNRYFNYLVLLDDNHTFLEKRNKKDIWQGLYQFPLIETTTEIKQPEELNSLPHVENFIIETFNPKIISKKHVLTHQNIHARFWQAEGQPRNQQYKRIALDQIHEFAIPRLIDVYINDSDLF